MSGNVIVSPKKCTCTFVRREFNSRLERDGYYYAQCTWSDSDINAGWRNLSEPLQWKLQFKVVYKDKPTIMEVPIA